MTTNMSKRAGVPVQVRRLRVGDRVRIKDRDAILATLDSNGRVDGLPFMPEMLAFVGQTFRVDAIAHRTCDTVKADGTGGTTRRIERTVHLERVRCDGSGHGGCQARCLIFWKEDWLEKAPPVDSGRLSTRFIDDARTDPHERLEIPRVLRAATVGREHSAEAPVYSCQATEMPRATSFVSARDPRMWIKDVLSRNAKPHTAVASLAIQLFNKWQSVSARLPRRLRIRDGRGWPSFSPTGEKRRHAPLNLQPGELVEVKSKAEIEATLDDTGRLRGLRFAGEMLPYCGTRARVLARVDRIIDEKTGRMLSLRDCVMLEDVWCEGTYRALCRRKIYAYWREAWLRHVDDSSSSESANTTVDSRSIHRPAGTV